MQNPVMQNRVDHPITAPLPLRTFAISAAAAVIGAVLVVLASAQGWPILVAVFGWLLLAGAIALAVVALVLVRLSRVDFVFDDQGFRISGRSGTVEGRWDQVEQVATAAGGHRISFLGDPDRHVVSPAPESDPRVQAMVADLKRRLDNSRGYRPLD